MTLLDRLTSFIFSEPQTVRTEDTEDSNTQKTYFPEPEEKNYMHILENINFDGKDYKSVYRKLFRYFELKPRSETFSPFEKKLIKQIVESVTESGDTPVKLKTTSILKRRRLKPTPKVVTKICLEKPAEIEERPPTEFKNIQIDRIEKPTVHEKPKLILKEEKVSSFETQKEYIFRGNGQRAKIFSARFDEDYEGIMEPKEPIQIETSQSFYPVYPDRVIPKFKTEDTEIPKKYELLLKEEAESLLTQQSQSQPKPSQELR
jgi:hypothetical protein